MYTVNKGHSVFSISRQELIAISLLSLYSVIEGLVVGLGLTNNNVWQLFAVILVHQIITSISLGKDNSKNGFHTKISRAKLSTHFGILSVVVCTKYGVLHWAWLGLCGGLCCT